MSKKILLVQLRQLGDIILTTPSLRELKLEWPDASIDFLCHSMGKLILTGNPHIRTIITYDDKDRWYQKLALLRSLKNERYDIVLDFMYNPRSALYSFSTRAPQRLAFPSRRRRFFTDIVPQSPKVEYIVREKFRYLEHLGIKPRNQALDLPWTEDHTGPVTQFLADHPEFRDAKFRVAISPTHRRLERQWPLERYAQIADQLVLKYGVGVVWIWGPGEEGFVADAMSLCQQPMLKAPKTSFRELAALLANCDLFLGNSNGPSHVAVSNTPSSLQLHGPTYAKAWCPMSAVHKALQGGVNLPDGRGPIDLIEVREVWHALEVMWSEVERVAHLRRSSGIRSNWTQRII